MGRLDGVGLGAAIGIATVAVFTSPPISTFEPRKELSRALREDVELERRQRRTDEPLDTSNGGVLGGLVQEFGRSLHKFIETQDLNAAAALMVASSKVSFVDCKAFKVATMHLSEGNELHFVGAFNSWYCISRIHQRWSLGQEYTTYDDQDLR